MSMFRKKVKNEGTLEKKIKAGKHHIGKNIAVVLGLSMCSYLLYRSGLLDPWFRASPEPCEAARKALESRLDREYTVAYSIEDISVDQVETYRVAGMYKGSELALSRGWSDEYLKKHFVAVKADYYVEYDDTMTSLDDGHMIQFFYVIQDEKSGTWSVIDNTSPVLAGEK